MKTTFTYIAIVSLLVALAIGLIYRGTRSSSLDVEQAASLFGKGMPPSLMTPKHHTGIDLDPDNWLQLGGSFQNVKAGDQVQSQREQPDK